MFVEKDGDENDEDVCENISYQVFSLGFVHFKQKESSVSEPF